MDTRGPPEAPAPKLSPKQAAHEIATDARDAGQAAYEFKAKASTEEKTSAARKVRVIVGVLSHVSGREIRQSALTSNIVDPPGSRPWLR